MDCMANVRLYGLLLRILQVSCSHARKRKRARALRDVSMRSTHEHVILIRRNVWI